MNKIVLEIHDNLVTALEKIKFIDGASIEVEIPEGAVILDNVINLKVLARKASDFNKSLHFHTTDTIGKTIISLMEDETEKTEGFITKHINLETGDSNEEMLYEESTASGGFFLTKIFKGFSFKLPFVKILLVSVPVLALLGVGYFFLNKNPVANVNIVVNSQPLTKSFSIKISNSKTTSVDNKTLRGIQKETTIEETTSIETTGETFEGEKAEGEVKLTNKTTDKIKLKKGTKLEYSNDDDEDLVFLLTSEVEIPAKVENPVDPANPTIQTFTLGEKSADVEAEEIGTSYNIDKNSNLSVSGYKSSELTAKATDDFSGGSSKTVKVVAKEDIEKLGKDIAPALVEKSEQALKAKENSTEKFISGAIKTTVSTQTFSAKEGEKADKLELKQNAKSIGLFYSKSELDSLIDGLVDKFIPDGFKLYSKDRDVRVEVLGESDNSVLNSEEADLQITLKTFVVPDINPEDLKSQLAGQSLKEAQKILGGIRNIKTYGLKLDGSIALPFFQKVPSDTEKIILEIELND